MLKKINRKLFIVIFLLSCALHSFAQRLDSIPHKDYSFSLMDAPSSLWSMQQFNQNYLSSYRLFSKHLNDLLPKKKIAVYINTALTGLFFVPLTHEEGHRSILTHKGIGAVSQPFFNSDGAAYVKGVRDEELKNLRSNDFPSYIRLHTAGLESDYMLTRSSENLMFCGKESYSNLQVEYLIRKLAIIQYYMLGLLEYETEMKEEANELNRDIVGNDIYGAARHLHRPDMEFYRYTSFSKLTREEKRFVKRMGYFSLLNLVSPFIIGKTHFMLSDNRYFNFSLGHTMAPFGSFVDENFMFSTKELYFIGYIRQFLNKETCFWGAGVEMGGYTICKNLTTKMAFNVWQQPQSMKFDTRQFFWGGAANLNLSYKYWQPVTGRIKGISVDAGIMLKSKGFYPEEVSLEKGIAFKLGTTITL